MNSSNDSQNLPLEETAVATDGFIRTQDGPGEIPDRLASYRIKGVLGRGGMGVVYDAEEDFPQRAVALKVVRSGLASPSMLRRFELEAQFLGRMQHSGVAQVFAAGTLDGPDGIQPFIAMERVDGVSFDRWLERAQPSIDERIQRVAEIADAIQHAHQKGVLHRDLKPANVLVEEDGSCKIVDFGIACASDGTSSGETLAGELVGTLPYMAPEQVAGDIERVDSRCDVYALGVILYECLAGVLPLAVRDTPLPRAIADITGREPLRLGDLDLAFRGDLETIAARALEKDPERRYPSAAALADDLRRHLRHEPIHARPATVLYQLTKFARRHRLTVALTAGLLVSLLVGLGATIAYAMRAESARESAEAQRDLKARINGILVDLIASASPYKRGPDTRVSEVLRETELRLERELAEDPEVEGPLRLTLTRAYRELGLYERAIESGERAVELLAVSQGENDVDTLVARAELLRARLNSDYNPELIDVAGVLLNDAERALGPDHREVLQIRGDKIIAELIRGRGDLVVDDAVQLIEHRQRALGTDHPDVPSAMVIASTAYEQTGQLKTAMHWANRAVEESTRILGPEHGSTIQRRLGWAGLLSWSGDHDAALAQLDELEILTREVFGEGHIATAEVLLTKGNDLSNTGHAEEAIPLLVKGIGIYEGAAGTAGPEVLEMKTQLGITFRRAGRIDEAEAILIEALEQRIALLGELDSQVGGSWIALGVLYRKTGRYEEALDCYQRCEEIDEALLTPDHGDAVWTQYNIADLHIAMGEHALAIPILRAIHPRRCANLGPEHFFAARDLEHLAMCLAITGDHAAAEACYRERLDVRGTEDSVEERWELTEALGASLAAQSKVDERRVLFEGALLDARGRHASASLVAEIRGRIAD